MSARRPARGALLVALLAFVLALAAAPGAGAATLPANFETQTIFSGIPKPVNFAFAPDGRVFVAEKNGKILVYENLGDQTPEVFANLAKPVYDFEDHGLLGLTLDPEFDAGRPYVYALYTFNHKLANHYAQQPVGFEPHSKTPQWSSTSEFEEDKCPEGEEVKKKHKEGKSALEKEGCEVSGVLVKLTAAGNKAVAAEAEPSEPKEEVLLEGWCQQSTTHSIGDLGWGPGGELFVSGGEGAMFEQPDYGQFENVCEDPPEPAAKEPVRLTAEGGSLRSQSVLRKHEAGKPAEATLLSGTLLRINSNTGEGWPGNPFAGSTEANARRIYSFGFRNPWRFAFNDRTGNIFLDNVGNGHYEEMDRIPMDATTAYNSGWPCYEGGEDQTNARNYEYAGEGGEPSWIETCKGFYKAEAEGHAKTAAPFFAYAHSGPIVPGDPCLSATTDIAGLAFAEGSAYPKAYKNALFFSDAIRGCIYVMKAGANGEPDPATASAFVSGNAPFSFPGVQIEQGPEGSIFYAEFGSGGNGAIKRIIYTGPPETEPTPPGPPAPTPTPTPQPTPPAPVPAPVKPKIKQRPSKSTKSTTAKFVFAGQTGMRFRCKVDGKSFSSCHSPRTYKHLKVGQHQFRVYAQNSAGERGTATVFKWQVVKP
jgi:glucose/arabinose dehydrogenase